MKSQQQQQLRDLLADAWLDGYQTGVQQIIKELGRDGSLTKQQQTALTAVLDQAMALARARVQR
jgi:hypothetical protein